MRAQAAVALAVIVSLSCKEQRHDTASPPSTKVTVASAVGRMWEGKLSVDVGAPDVPDVLLRPGPGLIAAIGHSSIEAPRSAVVDVEVSEWEPHAARQLALAFVPATSFEEALLLAGAYGFNLKTESKRDDSTVGLWQVMTTIDGRSSVCLTAIDRPGSGFVGWPFRPSRRQTGSFPFMWSSDGGCPEPNAGETLAAWFARLEHGGLKVVPLNRVAKATIVR